MGQSMVLLASSLLVAASLKRKRKRKERYATRDSRAYPQLRESQADAKTVRFRGPCLGTARNGRSDYAEA